MLLQNHFQRHFVQNKHLFFSYCLLCHVALSVWIVQPQNTILNSFRARKMTKIDLYTWNWVPAKVRKGMKTWELKHFELFHFWINAKFCCAASKTKCHFIDVWFLFVSFLACELVICWKILLWVIVDSFFGAHWIIFHCLFW